MKDLSELPNHLQGLHESDLRVGRRDMGGTGNIHRVLKSLCTKDFQTITGEMRDFRQATY